MNESGAEGEARLKGVKVFKSWEGEGRKDGEREVGGKPGACADSPGTPDGCHPSEPWLFSPAAHRLCPLLLGDAC